jgi:hypothetical protein
MLRVSRGRGAAVPARARRRVDPEERIPSRAGTDGNARRENVHRAHAVQVGRDSDYWLDGQKELYIVRHNYGTQRFFETADAIKMERVILPGDERGYRVTTDQVDFEFGFAYKNLLNDEWLYEIGEKDVAPLSLGSCTQRYGKFFNRVMTLEDPDADIEYVWGSCDKQCPAEDEDTSYTLQEPTGDIPACEDGNVNSGLEIGEGDDARLVQLRTGMLAEVGHPSLSGRSLISRDPYYEQESENSAQHMVSIVNPYPSNPLKILPVRVLKDSSNVLRLCRGLGRAWNTRSPVTTNCAGIDCAAARYDGPAIYRSASSYAHDELRVARIHYTIGRKGGGRAEEFQQVYSDAAYLPPTGVTLFAAGTWGDDLDARRLIITSGAPCGSEFWGNKCVRMLAPTRMPDATAQEAFWLGGAFGGDKVSMARLKAYVENGALKLAGVDARRGTHTCHLQAAVSTNPAEQYVFDALDTSCCDMNALWPGASTMNLATSYTQSGFGVGAVKFMLAPEMVKSLS